MVEEDSVTIPIEAVKDKVSLIRLLENHACHMMQMAMEEDFSKLTFDKNGAIEIASAILQLISITRYKGQS